MNEVSDSQAAGAAITPRSIVESYSRESLEADPPLALVDFSRPLAGWNVIRSSLSIGSIPTPVEGVAARKLIEAVTSDARTHDIRSYVPIQDEVRRFRLAALVRADERDQVRFWLGTGTGSSGAERVDVTYDLKTGQPHASFASNTWRILDADSEEVGQYWRICWIDAEVETAIPNLFVMVTTSLAQGELAIGDGKSGLWIGGLRVDALSEGGKLVPRQRVFADSVSDEILAFFRDEFDAAGDLYQWYRTRYLANNVGLSRIERAIANFVIRRFGATRKTLEVGAGVAQCSQFLSLCGVQTVGVEASAAHFEMMKRLVDRLSARFDPELAKRFTPLKGFYPNDVSSLIDDKTIVIVPGLGSTLTPEQEIGVFDALKPANGVILGVRIFFRTRESEEERKVMIEEVQKRGFGEPEVILRWDEWSFGFAPDRIIYLPKVR
mgnify:CR=1 FL=1